MENSLALRLVPDDLWELVEPLLLRFEVRPQGGGTAPVEDRAVFTAVVYVLTAGCAWRHLPAEFGVAVPTGTPPVPGLGPGHGSGPGCTRRSWTPTARPAGSTGRR
nr:transposase [Pseudofrankia saprophytica]